MLDLERPFGGLSVPRLRYPSAISDHVIQVRPHGICEAPCGFRPMPELPDNIVHDFARRKWLPGCPESSQDQAIQLAGLE